MKHHIFLFTMDITLGGGVERVVVNMANSFSKRKYKVNVISLFESGCGIKYNIDSKVKVKYLFRNLSFLTWRDGLLLKSNLYWRYLLSAKFTSRMYSYIDSELEEGETAIVLWNSYLITPLYRHCNVHIIGLDHSRYPFGNMTKGLRHAIHTYMIRNFDLVMTLNADELDKWKTIGKPVYVMPNYIPNESNYTEMSLPNRPKAVLSMGRMNTSQKGFDRLIEAYSLIATKHPDWKLQIYGCGCLRQDYICMVKNLEMQNYIEILDFTQNPKLAYQSASIYAMCSREEGFPMVLLEAGSQGLPIVAYDVEFGPKAIIQEGKTGYVISNGDKEAFAKALEKLMDNPILRHRMSEEIRKDISKRFSENVIMDKWINIINSL